MSNKKSARTGEQTNTTMPVEPPGYATLGDLLRSRAEQRLRSQFDTSGIEAGGIQDINSTFDPISMSVNNSLTSRGLAGSPVAGSADATLGAARGSQIAQFLNTLPQLRRQYENQDFAAASSLYNARPMGSTQHGTVINPGSAAGGAFGSAAEMLAFLAGQGMLSGGGNASAGIGINDGGWG